MVLDECTPFPATEKEAAKSMRLSMKWAERCRATFQEREGYGLFGIVQGSVYPDLRRESVEALTSIGFDGYAIGGLAVGEGQEMMFSVLDHTMPHMPEGQPRYMMGVGKPEDIVGAVMRGVDMFDCVLPTRSGRTGQAFTRFGTVNIMNARHADDPRPLDETSDCPASRDYSRAYLHHLFKSREILGPMLLTWHNLHYYQDLMAGLRGAIAGGRLADFAAKFAADQSVGDIPPL
jgi:queuine tRNA-ribosyltransferase